MVPLKRAPVNAAGHARARRRHYAVAFVLIAAAVAGCGKVKNVYFPLHEGLTWIYRQTVVTRNTGNSGAFEKSSLVAVATNLPARKIGEVKAAPRLFADGRALYYERMDDGVALIAKRAAGDETATAIAPRYVVKFPLAVGASWTSGGETEVIRRTFLGGYGAISKSVIADSPLVFTVESLNDTVHVPAGTFHHCLRLHGIGSARLAWGEPYGVLTINLDTIQWYAPKVGLVKRVRKEGTGPDGPLGGELTEELEAVKRPGWFQ